MSVRTGAARTLLAALAIVAAALWAAAASAANPPLPFERAFAAFRGDGSILRFNDFVGRIPEHRVKRLLRSGPVMGDRVLLDRGVSVYFPDGHIVSARTEFGKYRPKEGLLPSQVRHRTHLEIDDNYGLVEQFDNLLGRVCAETETPRGQMRLRVGAAGVISLVSVHAGRFDRWTGETTRSYVVVSVLDPTFLQPAIASELVAACPEARRRR